MGVGIDICKVDRIKLTDKFLSCVLASEEQEILKTKPNKCEFVAGRFACKEAFLKANGKGLFEIPLNQIKVLYQENGAPFISYNGESFYNVSISHEKEYAIAIVII